MTLGAPGGPTVGRFDTGSIKSVGITGPEVCTGDRPTLGRESSPPAPSSAAEQNCEVRGRPAGALPGPTSESITAEESGAGGDAVRLNSDAPPPLRSLSHVPDSPPQGPHSSCPRSWNPGPLPTPPETPPLTASGASRCDGQMPANSIKSRGTPCCSMRVLRLVSFRRTGLPDLGRKFG